MDAARLPPPSVPQPTRQEAIPEECQTIAETVGLIPSLRLKDNVVQGIALAAGAVLGGLVGLVLGLRTVAGPAIGAGLETVAGLVVALFVSGLVLGVVGLRRAMRRR